MDLPKGSSYEEICDKFEWHVPDFFNIADAVCDRWADEKNRVAITHESLDGTTKNFTFAAIRSHSNQLANLLGRLGLAKGDRVLVMLTQSPACAVSHIGCFKAGIVSCLASVLFGPDGVRHRLQSSGARVCVTDADNLAKVLEIRDQCPTLQHVLVVAEDEFEADVNGVLPFWSSLSAQSTDYD